MATAGLLRTDCERVVPVPEQQALKHYAGSRAATVRSLLLRFVIDNETIEIIISSIIESFLS